MDNMTHNNKSWPLPSRAKSNATSPVANEPYCLSCVFICYELALAGGAWWLAFSTHPSEIMIGLCETDRAAFGYDAVGFGIPSAELAARLTGWSRCLGFFALLLPGAYAAAVVRIATRNGVRLALLHLVSMRMSCGGWTVTVGYFSTPSPTRMWLIGQSPPPCGCRV